MGEYTFLRPKLTTRLIHGTIVQLVYAATIKKNGLLGFVSIETHSEGKVGRRANIRIFFLLSRTPNRRDFPSSSSGGFGRTWMHHRWRRKNILIAAMRGSNKPYCCSKVEARLVPIRPASI